LKYPVVVIGAGGHGKVVAEGFLAAGREVLGYCDPAFPAGETGPLGRPVLGDDDVLNTLRDVEVSIGIGLTQTSQRRRWLYESLVIRGVRFATLVHPAAYVAAETIIGVGAQIMAGGVVQTSTNIGSNCIVNTRASVDHDCTVGMHSHIAPGAVLCGNVKIGIGAYVGAGSVVIEGVSIGPDTVVGAGSTVLADVAAGARAFGLVKREKAG